jgi:cation transport ATPase
MEKRMALEGTSRPTPVERVRRAWNWVAAALALVAIVLYLLSRYLLHLPTAYASVPLWVAILAGGLPLLRDLVVQMLKRQFGADFLAGLSIVTSVVMGELLVATIIVLMLSGGQTLEEFAMRRASSVLNALARRVPSVAHRRPSASPSDRRVTSQPRLQAW